MKFYKPVVAQYNYEFYDKAETFIFNYINNLKNFYPIYFARKFINLDLFPINSKDAYQIPLVEPKRFSGPWFCDSILKIIYGICTANEEITLRLRKVKLIHAHFGPQGYLSLKLRGKLKIPIITTFYGYDVSRLVKDTKWIDNYAILFKQGDLFLVEGEYMKTRLISLGCPEQKIQIQRIAVPVDKIPFIARRPKKNDEKVVIHFSGRFVEKKGLMDALQAVKKLRDQRKNFEFRIVGDGPLRPEIEAFIKGHQLAGCVTLLGFLNYDEYLQEMEKADIFFHPSVTARDGDSEGGAPTVILEAQASGMPIVSTTHADIPNIVVAGKSALLSKERDVQGLVENIIYLLEHQDRWEEMGRVGRQFVEQYHNIGTELEKLEEKYTALINRTKLKVSCA